MNKFGSIIIMKMLLKAEETIDIIFYVNKDFKKEIED